MQKWAKNEVFDHFIKFGRFDCSDIAYNEVSDHLIKFGWFDWFDIAYNDSAKCFWTFGNGYRSCNTNLAVHNKHNLCKKEPKMSVLAMWLSLAYSIGLMLYILVDKNNIQVLMIINMLGRVINSIIISIIYAKKSQNSGFWPLRQVCLVWW